MRRFGWVGSDWQWFGLIAAAFIVLLLVNPLGYIGGGWDDWQYLEASRCWVAQGPCLPRTHWEGRWPVFAPIAAIVSVLGESRTTVGLWPLTASIAAIALLVLVGNRVAGRPVGWIAGLLFLVTPAFSIQILDPSVEAIELALILGGVLAILIWLEKRSVRSALLAGLSFGLAFQTRETSLIAALLAGMFVVTRKPRMIDIVAATAGFLSPLAVELLVYGIATGDPLFRRMLSLSHTQIPSSELLGPVDKGSPFFNPAYIANWRHEPGVHLHWLIDGFANLFINGKAGLSLALVPVLVLVSAKSVEPGNRRTAMQLYLLALFYAAILIYAFALDPKARVMFVLLTASSLALALLMWRLSVNGRTMLVWACTTAFAIMGLSLLFVHQRTDVIERPAATWIREFPGQIEMDSNTRKHLALVPESRTLPGLDSNRPYFLHLSPKHCALWIVKSRLPHGSIELVREQASSSVELVSASLSGSLCLFRYRRPMDVDVVQKAVRRARADLRYMFREH